MLPSQLPAKNPIELSTGKDVRSGSISSFTFSSLRHLQRGLAALEPVSSKLDSSYIVGAKFVGNSRTLADMLGVTLIQLDFDTPLNEDHQASVSSCLELMGIGHVSFETFSNGGKFVVLIPLARMCSAAEHRATIKSLMAELGNYGVGLDTASYNPVLPRFVSPNAANTAPRIINLVELPYLEPANADPEEPLPENVSRLTVDRFEAMVEQASPDVKDLFLFALRENLAPEFRKVAYQDWFPLIYAAFRAWGIDSRPLSDSQTELLQTLNLWSKGDPSWEPEAIKNKLRDWRRERGVGAALHIHSILTHEVDPDAMRARLADQPIMLANYNRMFSTVETVVSKTALNSAVLMRQAEQDAADKIKLEALVALHDMPAPTERMAAFRELLVEMITQGQATHATLSTQEWPYFLRPAPTIFGMLQVIGMGFSPHVLLREAPNLPAKALNPYFLNIARAGTGKSTGIDILQDILQHTVFSRSFCNAKLHSATGLWTNYFEPNGNVQLVISEEAESLFGKGGQTIDQHQAALHTTLKQLFDKGVPGSSYRPSAQVNRTITEMASPWCAIHLAGTPSLLREDISGVMLNDGFMSRVIVSIDERCPDDRGEEVLEQELFERMNQDSDRGRSDLINRAAGFINQLWKDSGHPKGDSFFDISFDDIESPKLLTERIVGHFNAKPEPRYISFPDKSQPELQRKFAKLGVKAKLRWSSTNTGTEVDANVESLRARSYVKMLTVGALLTLVADPTATTLDYDLCEWAERLLFNTQHAFYLSLLHSENKHLSVTKTLVNEKFVDNIAMATRPGGILFEKAEVTSREMREFNYSWRRLLKDLALPEGDARRRTADTILTDLDIGFQTGKNGGKIFFMTRGLEHGN